MWLLSRRYKGRLIGSHTTKHTNLLTNYHWYLQDQDTIIWIYDIVTDIVVNTITYINTNTNIITILTLLLILFWLCFLYYYWYIFGTIAIMVINIILILILVIPLEHIDYNWHSEEKWLNYKIERNWLKHKDWLLEQTAD